MATGGCWIVDEKTGEKKAGTRPIGSSARKDEKKTPEKKGKE